MREKAFMDFLLIAMVAGFAVAVVLKRFKPRLNIPRPTFSRQSSLREHLRAAWPAFRQLKQIGYLLSGVLLLTYLGGMVFVATGLAEGPPAQEIVDDFLGYRGSFAEYAKGAYSILPNMFFNGVQKLTTAASVAMYTPFLFVMAYFTGRWRNEVYPGGGRVANLLFWLLIAGCTVSVFLSVWTGGQFSLSTIHVDGLEYHALTGFAMSAVMYLFNVLAVSIGEGILLIIVYGALSGRVISYREAFEQSLNLLKPLYIFNWFYYGLLFIVTSIWALYYSLPVFGKMTESVSSTAGHSMMVIVLWLLRTMLLLTPFYIVKERVTAAGAVKKSLGIIVKTAVDYLALVVLFSIVSVAILDAFASLSYFVILPVTRNYYAFIMGTKVLPQLVLLWMSLFAFCVFAVFTREEYVAEGKSGEVQQV